ncbi:MAG: metallophosphoesterase [Alphaproteobacteria bacterium]|nr:metallophosphoesterase [Alphaproteobacteria bacterium]MBU1561549.1 metallophosphoesterase [Alphaproteobacteria bacterium]MBU2300968.1 metallophosphoesterase [Alphaproteobacteria bacterium]MBU2367250.1 metallophosphoesterase [Alphaproteobacteria bacterium]
MRIWVLSDLHNENLHSDPFVPACIPDADVCICAGDIDRGARESVDFMAAHIRPYVPVIGVLGNHEFYGHTIEREVSEARHWGRQRDVSMLENDVVVIDGVRFVGATLWTDFYLDDTPERSVKAAFSAMADYQFIGTKAGSLTPKMTAEIHRESIRFIIDTLETPFDGETVVVTHHSPSPRSVHEDYEGDPLNAAFHSNLEPIIERFQPALWVHGHTHCSFDYEIGRTRVVCNPRGYGDENKDFDPSLVVEIDGYAPKLGL